MVAESKWCECGQSEQHKKWNVLDISGAGSGVFERQN
jgi:hypothetical protein